MSRKPDHPLRALTEQERAGLLSISRSYNEPAAHVERAKALLAADHGGSFSEAARRAGRESGDAVGQRVARFNLFGLAALERRHGGGRRPTYAEPERERILREFERAPDRERDGAATWSLSLLRDALRRAPDGLSEVSTYTVWAVLHEAGCAWQRDRSWCRSGEALRKRESGTVRVVDPDSEAQKNSSSRPTGSARVWS